MKITTKLWIFLGVLILLSPLGLILPEHFKAGSAWGEWGVDEVKELVGYIPAGLEKLGSLWNAPVPDYAFQGWEEKGLTHLSFAYIFSGILGSALVVLVVWLMGKILIKPGK
jgi:cobalt/nickel transport protein